MGPGFPQQEPGALFFLAAGPAGKRGLAGLSYHPTSVFNLVELRLALRGKDQLNHPENGCNFLFENPLLDGPTVRAESLDRKYLRPILPGSKP